MTCPPPYSTAPHSLRPAPHTRKRSGPVRYDYIDGRWVYHRDGHGMRERLEQELQQLTGVEIHLAPDS